MKQISSVSVRKPAPFSTAPSLSLVLVDQVNTGRHYVRTEPAGTDMDMLRAEAQALETVGVVSDEDLAAWTLVDGVADDEFDMVEEDSRVNDTHDEREERAGEEIEEEREPAL